MRIVTVLGRRGSSRTLRVLHKGYDVKGCVKEIQSNELRYFVASGQVLEESGES